MTNQSSELELLKAENLKLKAACADKDIAIQSLFEEAVGRDCSQKYYDSVELLKNNSLSLDCGKSIMDELKSWKEIVKSNCEDEEEIKKLCRGVITDYEIDGDSYGVPGPVGIVESLTIKMKDLKAALKQCVEALELVRDMYEKGKTDGRGWIPLELYDFVIKKVDESTATAKQALGNPIAEDKKEGGI